MSKRKRCTNEADEDERSSNVLKKPRVLDDTYFKIDEWDMESSNISAKCTTCKKKVKGQLTSTGNFFKHIRSCHPDLLETVKNYCEAKMNSKVEISSPQTKQRKLSYINRLDQNKVRYFHI